MLDLTEMRPATTFSPSPPSRGRQGRPLRVALVCDMREEGWTSMDLCAEMLDQRLRAEHADAVQSSKLCPALRRRATRWPLVGRTRRAFNADRAANRLWDYPRWLRRRRGEFDVFHIIDHSYAHLAHQLPPQRTVVTCNDLDAFRCLFESGRARRSPAFRALARHVLRGLQRAACVACISQATRDELLAQGWVAPERARVVHLGVDADFSDSPDESADRSVARWLAAPEGGCVDLLHVGSVIARKRIDVLLRVLAAVRREIPAARLLRVGGPFTAEQQALADKLNLKGAIVHLPFLSRAELAAIYRRAALVLQPSEGEGFGLPVAEAMACGTPVLVSDLPALREVGGDAVEHCLVAHLEEWVAKTCRLLSERATSPSAWEARRAKCVARSQHFTWQRHAQKMVEVYQNVCEDA